MAGMRVAYRRLLAAGVFVLFSLMLISVEVVHPSFPPELRLHSVRTELGHFERALDIHRRRAGALPADLDALTRGEEAVLEKIPRDPWGSEYVYRKADSPKGYVLYSCGRNLTDEAGQGDDITTGPKTYSCDDYGVGCPSFVEVVQLSSLAIMLFSVGYLVLSVSAQVLRRWR